MLSRSGNVEIRGCNRITTGAFVPWRAETCAKQTGQAASPPGHPDGGRGRRPGAGRKLYRHRRMGRSPDPGPTEAHPRPVRSQDQALYGAPTEPTIRRALQGADGHAPGAAIDAWLPVRRALKRLRRLLQEVDIAGKVATTDPLHTQRETAPFLVEEKKPSISSPPSKAINENSAMLLSTRTSPKSAPKTA